MLTRLKVTGFKNLVDVDVRFGPFTCVAGANGVGKSNLFDAINFLSALADRPLIDAALAIRDEGGRTTDVRSLFHRVGDTYADQMSFETEMIVPYEGVDDLGQQAKASITFLRYALILGYRADENSRLPGALEIIKEELRHINLGEAREHLLFPHNVVWRKSAVRGQRRKPLFISTEGKGAKRIIKLFQNGDGSSKPLSRLAINLPRTVLSASNAAESPTTLLARREMQSWRLLQLEPSSLRRPDEFTAPTRLGTDGSHLAATLHHLARLNNGHRMNGNSAAAAQIYGQVANRLAELIDDVHGIWIDRDERRELLTLQVTNRDGTSHPARALSDGTLRFLALTVLELDPHARGLLCLEEPENGIHPERIPAMLRLLQDIATEVQEEVSSDNPLRQVIVNTHSPTVVGQIPDDSLLVAELKETAQDERHFKRVCFSCLPDTWRQSAPEGINPVSKGKLMSYLNPIIPSEAKPVPNEIGEKLAQIKLLLQNPHRVIDRPDLQMLIPFLPIEND